MRRGDCATSVIVKGAGAYITLAMRFGPVSSTLPCGLVFACASFLLADSKVVYDTLAFIAACALCPGTNPTPAGGIVIPSCLAEGDTKTRCCEGCNGVFRNRYSACAEDGALPFIICRYLCDGSIPALPSDNPCEVEVVFTNHVNY